MKEFTETGNVEFEGPPNNVATVGAQEITSSAQTFIWSVQYSLDGGTTWSKYKDASGVSDITGDDVKELRLISDKNRVAITDFTGATQVNVNVIT